MYIFILIVAAGIQYAVSSAETSLKSNLVTDHSSDLIYRWVAVELTSDVLMNRPDPAGKVNGAYVYLCRGNLTDRVKSGSLIVANGEVYCSISHAGLEVKLSTFQMLEATVGTTSWILTKELPENAVVGGHRPNEIFYICRFWHNGSLIVGHLSVPGGRNFICYATHGEVEYWTRDYAEVLIVNALGFA